MSKYVENFLLKSQWVKTVSPEALLQEEKGQTVKTTVFNATIEREEERKEKKRKNQTIHLNQGFT